MLLLNLLLDIARPLDPIGGWLTVFIIIGVVAAAAVILAVILIIRAVKKNKANENYNSPHDTSHNADYPDIPYSSDGDMDK